MSFQNVAALGDLNDDGNVSTTDLAALLAAWDTDPGHTEPSVWRLWSDGVIEENRHGVGEEWRGWEVVPEVPAP